jgi:hypothetical protein
MIEIASRPRNPRMSWEVRSLAVILRVHSLRVCGALPLAA